MEGRTIRRFLPFATLAAVAVLFTASAAQAAGGGGGGIPAGVYHLSDQNAYVCVYNGDTSFSCIFADQGNSFFLPGHGSGAPVLQPEVTVVSVFLQPNVNTPPITGCFIIPNTNFRIDANLGTAILNTTLPSTSNCGDNRIITASGREIPNPPSTGPTGSLTISLTWTGNGIVAQAGANLNYRCQGYLIEHRSTTGMSRATASGTVSALPGTISSPYTLLRSDSIDLNVVGDFNVLCPFNVGGGGG